jgi:hypothetical protein
MDDGKSIREIFQKGRQLAVLWSGQSRTGSKQTWRAKWRLQYTKREQKKSIGMVSGGLAKTLLPESRPEHIAHLICTVG